jgi:drug/metabolite transporter (DMT)-like permease
MVFGYISGIIQTLSSHYQKQYSDNISEKTLSLAQTIGGIFVGLGIAFSIGDFGVFQLPLHGLGIAIIFGFINYLINLFLVYGFKRADIGTGTILMSSELIFGPIMAYILFSEVLGLSEIVGGLFALAATVLVSRK